MSNIDLLFKVLEDASSHSCEEQVERDMAYAKRRFSCEGIKFLTVILPSLGKATLRGIETGVFAPPDGFRLIRNGRLPAFLQGWTKRIFHNCGNVRTDIDPHSLEELMQICMLFYKLELPYSREQENQVVENFILTENEIPSTSEEVLVDGDILSLARSYLERVLRGFDPRDIKPGHGPGAVATGEKGLGKYRFSRRYQRLHEKFPYYEFFTPSLSATSILASRYRHLERLVNPIAKVCLVSKDSRGPRLISMEPLEIQWIQQGQLKKLVPYIESNTLIGGSINFTRQSFNRQAAFDSSVDKQFATLDLKDASDRVSLSLFRALFPEHIQEYWEACRSVATQLPCGRLLPLKKFAPMGSALCFPVMALTLWALIKATLAIRHRSRRMFLVYGDDIVVPTPFTSDVIEVLESAGLKVNVDKSFINSHYRESCGLDAYNGVLCTPIRIRQNLDSEHSDPSLLSHIISASESFFDKGYWKSCSYMRGLAESMFGPIPWVSHRARERSSDGSLNKSSSLGFYSPNADFCRSLNVRFRHRWNPDFQVEEILRRGIRTRKQHYGVNYGTWMQKALLGLYSHSSESGSVAVRKSCSFRWGWYPIEQNFLLEPPL